MSRMQSVKYKVVDQEEARRLLTEARSGRGGRRSKYQPVLDATQKLEPGKALHLTLSRTEVQGLRQAIRKRFGTDFRVASSAMKGTEGQFHVIVGPNERA
jgi:type IV secretory pathway ATPase VirB11/archaellum biosynthesis ATPase